MKYIRWFPGDYLRDTIHLSWDEDCAYRRLLDAYYTADGNIPSDLEKIYALTRAKTGRQKSAVMRIAQEFFKRKGGKLIQKRARRELKRWRDFRIKCAKAGKRSAVKRLTGNERSTNVERTLAQPTLYPTPTPYKSKTLNSSSSQDQAIKPLERESQKKRLSLRHVPLERVTLDPSMIDLAQNQHIDASTEFQRLLDYNRARGVAVLHDVHAVWRRWIDSAVHYKKANGESGPTIDEQIAEYERNTGLDFYTQKPKRNTQPD